MQVNSLTIPDGEMVRYPTLLQMSTQLYPVIGVDSHVTLATNFGSSPFQFDVVHIRILRPLSFYTYITVA